MSSNIFIFTSRVKKKIILRNTKTINISLKLQK